MGGAAVHRCDDWIVFNRALRLLKNSGFLRDREGHDFQSCRNCREIEGGIKRLGDCCAEDTLFQQLSSRGGRVAFQTAPSLAIGKS